MLTKKKIVKTFDKNHVIYKKVWKHYSDLGNDAFLEIYEGFVEGKIIIEQNVSVVKYIFNNQINTFKYFDEDKYSHLLVDNFEKWETVSDIPPDLVKDFNDIIEKVFKKAYTSGFYCGTNGLCEYIEHLFWSDDEELLEEFEKYGIVSFFQLPRDHIQGNAEEWTRGWWYAIQCDHDKVTPEKFTINLNSIISNIAKKRVDNFFKIIESAIENNQDPLLNNAEHIKRADIYLVLERVEILLAPYREQLDEFVDFEYIANQIRTALVTKLQNISNGPDLNGIAYVTIYLAALNILGVITEPDE